MVHTHRLPCTVKDCPLVFTDATLLQRHAMSHTDNRPFHCDFAGCKKTYRHRNALKSHARLHTPNETTHRIVCPFDNCSHVALYRSVAKQHHRRHTQERPFACGFGTCERMFSLRTNRDMHFDRHSKNYRYVCTIPNCGVGYCALVDLEAHMCAHTGSLPHKCSEDDCGAAFIRKQQLDQHQARWHSVLARHRVKRSEDKLAVWLAANQFDVRREVVVRYTSKAKCGKTLARLDFVHYVPECNLVVVVENDEHQHETRSVSYECARMHDIVAAVQQGQIAWLQSSVPRVLFVRVNPHAYHTAGETVRVHRHAREEILRSVISNPARWMPSPTAPLGVVYILYDTDMPHAPLPSVVHREGYDQAMVHLVQSVCRPV
jgi:hypothetical protein